MCRMVKNIGKTLLVLPVAIAPFLSQMSVGRIDGSVTGLFIGAVFGRITEGDMSSLVIVIGKLAYLLLFHLLFGSYISGHFTNMPSYYFQEFHTAVCGLESSVFISSVMQCGIRQGAKRSKRQFAV